jgi:hypothetical protein
MEQRLGGLGCQGKLGGAKDDCGPHWPLAQGVQRVKGRNMAFKSVPLLQDGVSVAAYGCELFKQHCEHAFGQCLVCVRHYSEAETQRERQTRVPVLDWHCW